MTIEYQPKMPTFFSKDAKKKVNAEVEKRRRQIELSRDTLAKNIILPLIGSFQFAEFVDIDTDGNVTYTNHEALENLFWGGWNTLSLPLPPPKILSKELKACKINEGEYENFLKTKMHEFSKQGLLEKEVDRREVDLAKMGEVYQSEPGVWRNVKTNEIVESRIKTVETRTYSLKKGTGWYELLRKISSHDNPLSISFDLVLHIGRDPTRSYFETLPPPLQDFNSKLEIVDKIKEREAERRRKINPDLAFRLMRLHSNLMEVYSIATRDIIKDRIRSKFVTLRPPYILDKVVDSLPNLLGAIHLDALELSRKYDFPWIKQLQETVYNVSSREFEMKDLVRAFLKLENKNRSRGRWNQPKEKINYSAIENVLDETVFDGLAPFTIQTRNQLENSLGYGKKTYIFI